MRTFFIEAKYEGEIVFTNEVLDYLKKENIKKIALFAATQFSEISDVEKQMGELNIEILKTKAARTSDKMQILGCDCYKDSYEDNIIEECDLIVYIGDGLFHPKALLLSQIKQKQIKQVMIFDPIQKKMNFISEKDIEKQILRIKRNLKMFVSAKKIGILVTVKPGQQYLNPAIRLKEKLEESGKKAFVFIDDNLDLMKLENYPFIDAWVNTACPRIGTDDIVHTEKVIVNIVEASDPIKALEKFD